MENKEVINYKKRCGRCGATLCYLRLKTKERVCRICGYVEEIEDSIGENK